MRRLFPGREPELRFLVSCCNNNGGLFRVFVRGGKARIARISDLPCTGLAVSPSNGDIYAGYPDGVRAYTRDLKERPGEAYELTGAFVHDVKPGAKGELFIVETGFNRIVAYERPGVALWSWSPQPDVHDDQCHLNSINVTGDRLFASMFTLDGFGPPWKDRLDGAVVEVMLTGPHNDRTVRGGLAQPHSLVRDGETLWLCESRRRRVLRFSPSGEEGPEPVACTDGYARGLCVTPDLLAIGQSQSQAHFVRPLVGEDTDERPAGCGIWLISRHGQEREFIPLPAEEVYDVIALP